MVPVIAHFYNSTVRVEELKSSVQDGVATTTWVPVAGLEKVKCRLDLNFVRPGKDILPAPVAGKVPDRIGILFTSSGMPLKAGQRVVAIPDKFGSIPVKGTFEIRVVPDEAIGFSDAHHIEVQIIEVAQKPAEFNWPPKESP